MTATSDVEDPELQEAIKRSLEVTNLEEAMVAKALAESISTRDEEIARAMQREQLLMLERSLCDDVQPSAHPTPQSQPNNRSSPQASAANDALSDEEVAQLWQQIQERDRDRAQRRQRREKDIQLRMQYEGSLSSQREEAREKDIQLRMQYEDALSSQREEASRENVGASASVGSSSQALRQQTSPTRYDVRRRISSDAEKRRRLENTVENEVGVSTNPTSEVETSAAPAASAPSASAPSASAPSASAPPAVVVDGQNVAYAYEGSGNNPRFCARGVQVVLDYYHRKGIRAVAMLPLWRSSGGAGANLLRRLADEGRVSFTPSGSHDDNFILAYAQRKNIDIVSNDRFIKEIDRQATPGAANALQKFLNEHLIPYTFVNREFLPEPNPCQLSGAEHSSREPRHRR